MDKYILSRKTQEDIDEIFEYGVEKFGKDKAIEYLIDLKSYFELLLENPDIGKNRNEIKIGLISFPFRSHIIFYRLFSKHIRIVRVLYGGRDLVRFLK